MKKLTLNICLILMIGVLSECTINKRHYRNGYQVSWNKNKVNHNDQSTKEAIKLLDVVEATNLSESEKETPLYASINNTIPQVASYKKSEDLIKLPNDSCGDIITMVNGDEFSVKVIEINQRTVKYKSCDNLGGPLFVESKEKIFMIKYANGTKDVFSKTELKPNESVNSSATKKPKAASGDKSGKKINPLALVSLICCGAFFLYFPLALAPIFAVIACFQFKKHPDKYRAKGMVIPALIIGAIIITVLILSVLVLV